MMNQKLETLECMNKNCDGSWKIWQGPIDWELHMTRNMFCSCESSDGTESQHMACFTAKVRHTDNLGRQWVLSLAANIRAEQCDLCGSEALEDDHYMYEFGDYGPTEIFPGYKVTNANISTYTEGTAYASSKKLSPPTCQRIFGRSAKWDQLKERLQKIEYVKQCATCINYTLGLRGTCRECRNRKGVFGNMKAPKDADKICSICQDSAEDMEHRIVTTPCKHRFHRSCILKVKEVWDKSHNNSPALRCPICRADLAEGGKLIGI